jgi:hypothetical protein
MDTGMLGEPSQYIPFVWDPRFHQLLKRFHAMEGRYYIPGIRLFGYYDTLFKDYLNIRHGLFKIGQGYLEMTHPAAFDRAALDRFIQGRRQFTTGFFPVEDQTRRLLAHITGHPERLFFLVVTPFHPTYYQHFQNETKFKDYEARLAAHTNVVVIDWGRMPYPEESFLDTLHLRQDADRDFSRKLGEKIREVLRERNKS